jgi:hypothetical protein
MYKEVKEDRTEVQQKILTVITDNGNVSRSNVMTRGDLMSAFVAPKS